MVVRHALPCLSIWQIVCEQREPGSLPSFIKCPQGDKYIVNYVLFIVEYVCSNQYLRALGYNIFGACGVFVDAFTTLENVIKFDLKKNTV